MSIDYEAIVDAVASHAMALGIFDRVNQHEPKAAPGNNVTAAVWVDLFGPAESGLASTSVRVVLMCRIYQNFILEPQDRIDPIVMNAADQLCDALTGDFTLGGLARNLDLLGRGGTPLSGKAGYLNQDGSIYRILDVTMPVVLNDVWEQVA